MTLNEVNIIKNSVLDATEAYVDARLAVADFAKTQIGVTVGEPIKKSSKYYHKVRCNAIKGVEGSGVLYQNVLAVGNTAFPAGSVVFVIAPNAQFSNQFILGKLDNTPIEIVGGSIKIGGDNPDTNPVFEVKSDGTVTIKAGGIYLNKATGNNYHLVLDNSGIKLGYTSSGYNFTASSSDGTVTIRKGQINLGAVTVSGNSGYDVNINKDGFNLGYLGKVNNVDAYNFSVTDKGKVTINSGSIKIVDKFYVNDTGDLFLGGTDANAANFYVTHNGNVTIKEGRINLNYNTTLQGYNFSVDSNGIKLGLKGNSTSDKYYNFTVDNDGKVTIKSGTFTIGNVFKIDENGDLFSGGTSTSNAKFHVDNTGNMFVGGATLANAPFYVTNLGVVRISQGLIALGGTASSPNFYVDVNGNVAIKSGSWQIGNVFKIDGHGNIASGGVDSNANFYVQSSDGSVFIKKGDIDINNGKFHVDSQGNLTAKYLTANVGGQIAGFTISSNSLTTGNSSSAGDTNARSELSSTTLRVSKWTGSKRVSGILDVNDNNGRLVINGDNATEPYIAVTSLRGWADNGNFPNPLTTTSGNYVRITPTSIALKENNTASSNEYSLGAEVFKFLSQSQSVGTLGNLRIMVSNSQISFTNVATGKSGFITLT